MARAIFSARQDSVSFNEREMILTEPVKVGRSVGELRPAANNAFFHCKVLSRNHALIWYDSKVRKFFVQDTKSSNGTFVNRDKIGPKGEAGECPPREIFSGDVIQFGVEVSEQNKKGKDGTAITVTHGCIVAIVRLIHQDGKEAGESLT